MLSRWFTKKADHNKKIVLLILLVIILLEVSVFNIRHWSTRFTEPSFNIPPQEFVLSNVDTILRTYEPPLPQQIDERGQLISTYLDSLADENIVAVIAVSDSASAAFCDAMAESFQRIGLYVNLQYHHRLGYAAILSDGQVIFEQLAENRTDTIYYDTTIGDVSFSVTSAGFDALNLASIKINGVEYALNNRGLNIVIYDKNAEAVIDSFSVDTHEGLIMHRGAVAEPRVFQAKVLNAELTITNINENIRTILIQPYFINPNLKVTEIGIRYQDENTTRTHVTQIINGYTPSFYIPIGTMGNVDNMTFIFRNINLGIQQISFNETIPWSFQWVRVIFLTVVIALIYFLKKSKVEEITFNPKSIWQKILDIGVVSTFICLLLFVLLVSNNIGLIPGSDNSFQWNPSHVGSHGINGRMVDAILLNQLHLDIQPHESLLNATQPHSPAYRVEHGVIAPWDHVFFNGRLYSYFGIVPVIVLFLPYYLISGVHLSATAATFIFSAISAVGIYFFWKELAKKYLEKIPYVLYLSCLTAALFGSNLLLLVVRAHQYETAIASGLMFSIWGLFFIFKAVEDASIDKTKTPFLILGTTFMALAVGCRPTMLFCSLVVPVMLFPTLQSCLKERKIPIVKIAALALPYLLIGAGLAWYNFARFGSILEFGANYQITAENVSVVTQTGFLGNFRRAFDGIFSYLFTAFSFRPHFPFIFATTAPLTFTGHFPRHPTIGIFALPITWFLPAVLYIRKNESVKKMFPQILAMFLTAVVIIILSAVLIGVLARYTVDFYWLIILPSLVCMGLLYKEALSSNKTMANVVMKLGFTAVIITCFILFGWGMVGEHNQIWHNNPSIIRFLSDLIMFF